MELAVAAGSLKVAFNLVVFGIQLDQVPAAVRRCFELVRTCHRDLEDLIKLRNESLPMLKSKPAILERLNTIIENAHKGLLDVARLVEKLRPEVHNGSSPFLSRLEWIFIDSREFTSQESLISRQHSSVIAELNFLRQLLLLTPLVDGVKTGNDAVVKPENRPVIAWDNVALLDEMLGGNKRTYGTANPSISGLQEPSNANMSQVPPISSSGLIPTDPPPRYTSPNPTFALPSAFLSQNTESRHPFIYNVTIPDAQGSSGATVERLAAVESKTKTTFDNDGVAFLFSDIQMPLTKKEAIPSQLRQLDPHIEQRIQQPSEYDSLKPMTSPIPLSTIPQELIYRHGSFDGPLRSPPTQTVAIPAVAPAAACSPQPRTWQQVTVPRQNTPSNPSLRTPSPFTSSTPQTQCYISRLAPAPRPVSSQDSTRALPQSQPSYLSSVDPVGRATYATTPEHWQPDHLTLQSGRHQNEPTSVLAPSWNDEMSAAGFQNAISREQALRPAQSSDALRRTQNGGSFFMLRGSTPDFHSDASSGRQDISELSALPLPDPVELE